MFRISKRLDYGVRMLAALAVETENRPLATAVLAERLSIPLPFLHQIGHVLMQAGFIKAMPGPRGGLRLNRQPGSITLLNIVEALEGMIELNPEARSIDDNGKSTVMDLSQVWDDLQELIKRELDSITLDQVITANQVEFGFSPVQQFVN